MALDPSIILGVKPYQQDDPLERFSKLATLETARGQQEIQRQQIAAGQQKVADDAATREAFKGGGTESEIYNRLAQVNPTAAMAYQKHLDTSRSSQAQTGLHTAQAGKAQWEIDRDKLAHGAALLGEARDGASFSQVLETGLSRGYWTLEQARQMLQPGYSPEHVKRLQAGGMTQAQTLDEQGKAEARAQTAANAPFNAGPGGTSVPNLPVQKFQLDKAAGQELKPHYDAERGIIVDPRTGQGTPITMGGQPVGAKPNAATQKELMTIGQQESTVDGALAAVKKTPGAFGFSRGAATMSGPVAESVRGRFDSKEESEARSYVFNIVSKVINERAGAAQSAQELARLRSFLPGEMDNATQIENKLNGFKTYLADLKKGTTPTPSAAPPGTPGGAPSMRVTPEQQNARDNEAGAIRASQAPPSQIENDIASVETALRGQRLDGTQRGILERELNLLRRAREIQRGGGAPAATVAPGGATGGRTVKRTGVLNGRKVVEYSDGTVDYAQ